MYDGMHCVVHLGCIFTSKFVEESVKIGLRRGDALCRSKWGVGVNQIAAG